VTEDVVADGALVIRKGTAVVGVVAKARAASWGFLGHRDAQLSLTFSGTTATNGRRIRLRTASERLTKDRVTVDRDNRHHELLWAGPADTFVAYVDGEYDF
jgi:hypothetical protein